MTFNPVKPGPDDVLIPVRLRVEGAAPTRSGVIDVLFAQARQFYGDEDFRLQGDISVEVESYVDTMQGGHVSTRWAGLADFVNYREQ